MRVIVVSGSSDKMVTKTLSEGELQKLFKKLGKSHSLAAILKQMMIQITKSRLPFCFDLKAGTSVQIYFLDTHLDFFHENRDVKMNILNT